MKTVISLIAVVLLAGCSTQIAVPFDKPTAAEKQCIYDANIARKRLG
jgi:uncharacterized lipoprotein YajG